MTIQLNKQSMRDEAYWENLVKRSLCRFLLLGQLAKGPVHGYQLNLAIRDACQGCCEPTEAMEMTACLSSVPLFPDRVAGNLPPPRSDVVGVPEERTIHFGLGADTAAMELTDCQTYTQVLPGLGTAAALQRDGER